MKLSFSPFIFAILSVSYFDCVSAHKHSKHNAGQEDDETIPSSRRSNLRATTLVADDPLVITDDGPSSDDPLVFDNALVDMNALKSTYSSSSNNKNTYNNIQEVVGLDTIDDDGTDVNDTSDEEYMEHIIITCPEDQSPEECKRFVLEVAIPEEVEVSSSLSGDKKKSKKPKIMHELKASHSIAVELSKNQLDALNMEYEMDPVRELMHLPGSYEEVDDVRRLAQSIPEGITQVMANQVWQRFGITGRGVTVCVVDSGLFAGHEDFRGARVNGSDNNREVVTPWDSDGNGHGTHVTGTVGARNNGDGVVGVAPDVNLFIVRVFDNAGVFRASDIHSAAEECRLGGADIISMSLGGTGFSSTEERELRRLYNDYGIITVAAAGNSGNDNNAVNYPAAHDIVVSVGAVDFDGRYANFSTRNNRVDIAAPGVRVLSTSRTGGYSFLSGTSMSTPHVSGVLALLKSFRPNASANDLVDAITSTADDKGPSGRDSFYGHGVIQALDAMEMIERLYPENDGNNNNDNGSPPACLDFNLLVITDGAAEETSYRLTPYRDNLPSGALSDTIFYAGYNRLRDTTVYRESACLDPRQCFQFNIYDARGNGIYGRGRGIRVTYDGSILYEGRSFGYGGYIRVGDSCP